MDTDIQKNIQALLDQFILNKSELGLRATVYLKGELVADAWAGFADRAETVAVDETTLFPLFSCAKGISATVVHRLVERGLLEYDQPIADYWPEFARNGKESITMRQVLNHTAGLANMPEPCEVDDLKDWDGMCHRMEQMTPEWPTDGDTRQQYHAITFSWLVGEPCRRVTEKSFSQLVQEEIAIPLGLEGELYIGLPEQEKSRVAELDDTSPPAPAPEAIGQRYPIPAWVTPLGVHFGRKDILAACIPASNGVMTSKALAMHFAALMGNGVEGQRLISRQQFAAATKCNPQGDQPEFPGRFFSGYAVRGHVGTDGIAFGHGGAGGSLAMGDTRYGLAMALAKNRMGDSPVATELEAEVYQLLGLQQI
jgi:CubicO group peptidase (beta-lactamase class C family)